MTDSNPPAVFDPLAVENIGVTLAVEWLAQPLLPMPPEEAFRGAGVYALYYSGGLDAYKDLVSLDAGRFKYPVYIGKASGESAKQGFSPHSTGSRKLFDRIKQHAESIAVVDNLNLADFRCRVLVMNDAYIGLAESVMIRVFRPPWNGMSFGSKVVGKNRMTGEPALWDSLHPGRGGRPAGSSERATKAAELISKRVSELRNESSDLIIRRMHDRIMKFI